MADPYYQFYPGDYARDTAHLSLTEHGAYRLLLDAYYTGGPLSSDIEKLVRIVRAWEPFEREAVVTVVKEFFKRDGDRLRHKRADKEKERREQFLAEQKHRAALSVASRRRSGLLPNKEANHTTTVATTVDATVATGAKPAFNLPSPSPSPEPTPLPNPKPERESQSSSPTPDTDPAPAARTVERPGRLSLSFSPPSVEEVRIYCNERGNAIDPARFVAYYSARGWKIDGNIIADWKALVISWETQERGDKTKTKPSGPKAPPIKCDIEQCEIGLIFHEPTQSLYRCPFCGQNKNTAILPYDETRLGALKRHKTSTGEIAEVGDLLKAIGLGTVKEL